MILRRFQQAGHRPIALVGGATGMIGDPSGKSEERNLLSVETLQANVAGMEAQLRRFLDFDCGARCGALLVNNYDWMGRFGYLEFLRDVGKHFPVNVMLTKDSVRNRLERTRRGLSYTEFSYMLLQAYDFVHLNEHYGCELQAGGSDQWGNITAGIDLARRHARRAALRHHLPAVDQERRREDGQDRVGRPVALAREDQSLSLLSVLDQPRRRRRGQVPAVLHRPGPAEVEAVEAEHLADPGRRTAQRRLAAELTRLVHGDEGLAAAQRATEIFFGAEIGSCPTAQLAGIFADVPSKELPRQRLAGPGLPIIDALVEAGLAKSKCEARRIIAQGGAYVNNRRVSDVDARLGPATWQANRSSCFVPGRRITPCCGLLN